MKTIRLIAIMGILFAGYSVATKATTMVSTIKTSQQYQVNLLK